MKVLIVGGTHGGESTGVYLLQKFAKCPQLLYRENVQAFTLLANPKACQSKIRYINRDLNRCFKQSDLDDLSLVLNYEDVLAKNINNRFGSNSSNPVDVIIDLHSTTSEMGVCILTYNIPENLKLVSFIQRIIPSVNVILFPLKETSSALPALCQKGLGVTIEVGPIAEKCLDFNLFNQSELLVKLALDYYNNLNQVKDCESNGLTYFLDTGISIDYPREPSNPSQISAMLHPSVQNFTLLSSGDPVFISFDGEIIFYEGEALYPIFVGESSYIEKGIALSLSKKVVID